MSKKYNNLARQTGKFVEKYCNVNYGVSYVIFIECFWYWRLLLCYV